MQEFTKLYNKSGAQQFGLTSGEFGVILEEVRERYLPSDVASAEAAKFFRSLRLEDLALARACAQGSETAWNLFLDRYRQKLYRAAAAITKDELSGRDLADSLYAELFGIRHTGDGRRVSKLASYTGRGSLEGWLRTVLGQEYVNQYRNRRRLVSFEEQTHISEQLQTRGEAKNSADPRLQQATDEALLQLSTEERMLLASYYLDGRTLAEIARMLGMHQSTISRRVEKTTAGLRKRIIRNLRKRGLDARSAAEAMESDIRELSFDLGPQEKIERAFNK